MILKEVIVLSEKGDFLEDFKEGESFSLIIDLVSLKALTKEIFSFQYKKLWFLVTFLLTATYIRNESGLSKIYSKSIFEIYDTFESMPSRVEFEIDKKLIKKKILLLSNPLINESFHLLMAVSYTHLTLPTIVSV